MTKRLSLLFISLLLISTLVAAFHHHDDDGAAHHDCPICVVYHQPSDVGCTAPSGEIHRQLTETACPQHVLAAVTETFFNPANSRAPPV